MCHTPTAPRVSDLAAPYTPTADNWHATCSNAHMLSRTGSLPLNCFIMILVCSNITVRAYQDERHGDNRRSPTSHNCEVIMRSLDIGAGILRDIREIERQFTKTPFARRDLIAVERWLTQEAASGNTSAKISLGVLYQTAPSFFADQRKALQYYLEAAADGDRAGQYNAGMLLAFGPPSVRDHTAARLWLRIAIANGADFASMILDILESRGVTSATTVCPDLLSDRQAQHRRNLGTGSGGRQP
jgi:hypothetical protein